MLLAVEQTRLRVSKSTEAKKKSSLGQFLTPAKTATFMAGLFPAASGCCHLLDAGAGIGSLSSAFLEGCLKDKLNFDEIHLTAYELDELLKPDLHESLKGYTTELPFSFDILCEDFIEMAVNRIQFDEAYFTHAILNPPYKKIGSDSRYRLLLRQVGIETVNLYAAFVALTILLMKPGGQIVAIIPRSFCNGSYYRPFRNFLLEHTVIHNIHLFDSRNKAFKDDNVLQENIIIRLERDGATGPVTISTSTDDSFSDLVSYEQPFERVVYPDDPERYIHVSSSAVQPEFELLSAINCSLKELGINISTGPVVDFRLKEHLRDLPEKDTAPLLYPVHFNGAEVTWPVIGKKKPNAIKLSDITEKWLYPNGFYCVVRRFSSKEEKRRVVASVVNPSIFNNAPMLGFENHLNVFHENKQGLPEELARGLAVFLNTSVVDEYFRCFSGHTQVNATDLKRMKYPGRDILIKLGRWALKQEELTQVNIDDEFRKVTS